MRISHAVLRLRAYGLLAGWLLIVLLVAYLALAQQQTRSDLSRNEHLIIGNQALILRQAQLRCETQRALEAYFNHRAPPPTVRCLPGGRVSINGHLSPGG